MDGASPGHRRALLRQFRFVFNDCLKRTATFPCYLNGKQGSLDAPLPMSENATSRSILLEAPGIVLGLAIFGLVGYLAAGNLVSSVAGPAQGCSIKGNVSINSGEKIYHVAGQNTIRRRRSVRNSGSVGFAPKPKRWLPAGEKREGETVT